MEALRSAMIIGALPFTMVMGLMCIALGKALYRDGLREKDAQLRHEYWGRETAPSTHSLSDFDDFAFCYDHIKRLICRL